MGYSWNFGDLWQYAPLWGRGVGTTLLLSAYSIVFGSLVALALVALRRSNFPAMKWLSKVYIDIFRALPIFVLLSLLFFVVPILTGIRLSAWQCCVVAFSINLAPFAAECIRAGVESIPVSQYESAQVLGFSRYDIFWFIIAPQAFQRILPSLLGEYVTTIKLTSLAGVLGVEEIWNVGGQIVSRTSLTLEARIVAAGLYVALILPLIWMLNALESRYRLRGVLGASSPPVAHVHGG